MRDQYYGAAAPHLRPAEDVPSHLVGWLTLYTVLVMGLGGVCGWLLRVLVG